MVIHCFPKRTYWNAKVKTISPQIGEAEKREALERVLASNAFHRTGQLKSLLKFVCEREISGKGESLDECTVAVEALGRPAGYSPFEDGTVRNRIHNLRRRLEQYYEVDNPEDPIQILVPKGSYCPVFEHRVAPFRPAAAEPPPTIGFWLQPIPVYRVCLLLAAAGLLVLLYAAARPQRPSTDPILQRAWGPILGAHANPLLCISTAAQMTLIQRPPEQGAGPLITSPELEAWYRTLPGLPPARQVFLSPSLTSPFWGDVAGAFAINNVLSAAGIPSELLPESAIQMPALNRRNVLMFGRPGFSRIVDRYLSDKPFRVRIPDEHHVTAIWNVEPKAGEPSEYDAATSPPGHGETAYGLITVMPSLGDANLRTVVFSGTLSPGTQAASEYFSSPKHLKALLAVFQQEGFLTFPAAYQVVVRASVFNTSALDVRYVAHRVTR